MQKYFGSWKDYEGMKDDFFPSYWSGKPPADFPSPEEIIYARYDVAGYEGDALVIFERDGKLYEVNGAHCSCYGLEGQWEPEETSWKALAMRASWGIPGTEDFRAVVAAHLPETA